MCQAHRDACDGLQGLLHPTAANDLRGQCLGFVEQAHQPGLELVGQEVPDGTDVQDRRRPLVETRAQDIEQPISLAHLGPAHHDHPLVGPGMNSPFDGYDIGRDPGVTWPRET